MRPNLIFAVDGRAVEIELFWEHAPRTLELLMSTLPAEIDLHCAKIAGKHLFWHTPVVTDIEGGVDVMEARPGAFLYWPERQFLELTYGPLQTESAQVTMLGTVRGDLDWLAELGRSVVRESGHTRFVARLGRSPEVCDVQQSDYIASHALRLLREACAEAWRAEPGEVARVMARRGTLGPFGPLVFAESEFRQLQQALWALRGAGITARVSLWATAAALLRSAASRIAGLCHMTHTASVLTYVARDLEESGCVPDGVLDDLIRYAGRLAGWLDLYICWYDANEAQLRAYAAAAADPANGKNPQRPAAPTRR